MRALFEKYGVMAQPQRFDVIVVGAGAGGCPLAQTLVEGGKKVLLIERGGERGDLERDLSTSGASWNGDCLERISADGYTLGIGNCMGGTL